MQPSPSLRLATVLGAAALAAPASAQTVILLAQDWTDASLLTTDNNWSSLWDSTTHYGIIGYRGDGLTAATGVNPQTLLADGTTTPVSVLANRPNPNTLSDGGVAEFTGVVGLQGSGTADAPFLLFSVSAVGYTGLSLSYLVRDLDGSNDNAAQSLALHYRLSDTGAWTNLSLGYIADATTGPGLSGFETSITASLGLTGAGSTHVQFRVMTTNALGTDEWVGIDDIMITGTAVVPEPGTYALLAGAVALATVGLRRRGLRRAG